MFSWNIEIGIETCQLAYKPKCLHQNKNMYQVNFINFLVNSLHLKQRNRITEMKNSIIRTFKLYIPEGRSVELTCPSCVFVLTR